MTQEERCEIALQANEPERALRALVLDLAKEGRTKAELCGLLETLLIRLRAREGVEDREDAVLNVMDALTGWCHPDARLLPDDSSLAPSGGGSEGT
jgi:hypothetical protein